jgi:uncharacterized radical SAM superfamily Fe-S cluster-containing enzyme
MIDILWTIETKLIGDMISRVLSAAWEWWRERRKKPSPDEVKQKVKAFAAEATKTVVPTGTLSAQDQRRLAGQIAELTLPSFEQVVQYSPNTQPVMLVARKAAKKRKRVTKTAIAKRVVRKHAVVRKALKTQMNFLKPTAEK